MVPGFSCGPWDLDLLCGTWDFSFLVAVCGIFSFLILAFELLVEALGI